MRTVSRSGQNASQEIDCEARIYAFDLWFTARNVERDFQDRLVLSTKKNEKACGFFVDANVLAICRVNRSYKRILSNADFNFIDGRLVALLVSWFLGTKISAYPGPKFFDSFCSVPGRHLIIGGSRDHFDDVVQEIHKRGYDDATFTFLDVPFCNVDEFDFEKIGKDINDLQPDIVWVSLGAPKQEIFIMNVLPYVNRGYFFAVGAALGFFCRTACHHRKIWKISGRLDDAFDQGTDEAVQTMCFHCFANSNLPLLGVAQA